MSKLRCGFSETILGPNPDPLRTQPIHAVCVFIRGATPASGVVSVTYVHTPKPVAFVQAWIDSQTCLV